MIVRGESLSKSMSHYLVERINTIPNISVVPHSEVVEVSGDDRLEEITVRHHDIQSVEKLPAAALFIFIGAEPHTEWLNGVVCRDNKGFLLTGTNLLSNGKRPRGLGNSTAIHTCSKRAFPASSLLATSAIEPSAASLTASVKAPSCSTSSASTCVIDGGPMQQSVPERVTAEELLQFHFSPMRARRQSNRYPTRWKFAASKQGTFSYERATPHPVPGHPRRRDSLSTRWRPFRKRVYRS